MLNIKKLIVYLMFISCMAFGPWNAISSFAQTENPPNPPLLKGGKGGTLLKGGEGGILLKGGEGGILLDIRERLIRLEEGQKALNQRIDDLDKRLSGRIDDLDKRLSGRIDSLDKRIDSLGKRIDDLANLNYVILAGMFALVGFVLWDRRSALAPAIRRTRDIEDREEKLERAIKEFALKNPEMKEILKSLGLL